MIYEIGASGIRQISQTQRFTEVPGHIVPKHDHHVDNHAERYKPERTKFPNPELPLLSIHERPDPLGFSDPAEQPLDPDIIDRRATSGSGVVRGIDPGQVYSLFDSETDESQ